MGRLRPRLEVEGCLFTHVEPWLDANDVVQLWYFDGMPDTPEKLARLKTLTPRKLVPHQRDGKLYFVYADPDVCKCLYAGTEQNYQEYQRLGLQRRLADEQLMAAQDNLYGPMNWDAGGYWPW